MNRISKNTNNKNWYRLESFPKGIKEISKTVADRRRNIMFLMADNAGREYGPKAFLGYLSPEDGSFKPALSDRDPVNVQVSHTGKIEFRTNDSVFNGLQWHTKISQESWFKISASNLPSQPRIKKMEIQGHRQCALRLQTNGISFASFETQSNPIIDSALKSFDIITAHQTTFSFDGMVSLYSGVIKKEAEEELIALKQDKFSRPFYFQNPDLGEYFLSRTVFDNQLTPEWKLSDEPQRLSGLDLFINSFIDPYNPQLVWHFNFCWEMNI